MPLIVRWSQKLHWCGQPRWGMKNASVLCCAIAHQGQCFLGSQLFRSLFAVSHALADDIGIQADNHFERLVMIGTAFADKQILHLFLRILLHDFL